MDPCHVLQELAQSLTSYIALVLFGYVWMSLNGHFRALKGNRAFADLRYGEDNSISPSTLLFAVTKR